jgi:hypothetical protein
MRAADHDAVADGAGQEPGFRFMSQNSKAGLETAVYLARAARDAAPRELQTFELPPMAFNRGPKRLPRIAHVFPVHSHQHPTRQNEPVFYASNVQGFMPPANHRSLPWRRYNSKITG